MRIEFSEESGYQDPERFLQELHSKNQLHLNYGVIAPAYRELILYVFSRTRTHVQHLLERMRQDDYVSAAGRLIITDGGEYAFDFDQSFSDAQPDMSVPVLWLQEELKKDIQQALGAFIGSFDIREAAADKVA